MKRNETLWRLSVTTTLESEDAVGDVLNRTLGQHPSTYRDIEKRRSIVSVFGPRKEIAAPKVRAAVAAGLRKTSCCGLNVGSGRIETARVPREDWAESWKRHFQPIEIGRALLIKPSWAKPRLRKHQAVVTLDPGLSFGTGNHATTAFCLREILRHRQAGAAQSLLDVGTGSGILAIAAAKLGYGPIRAIDFDPEAVRVARANARVNRVAGQLALVRGDVKKLSLRPARQFHVVAANLMADLLLAERRRIAAQLRRDGTLILAGILRSEFVEVRRAFGGLGLSLAHSRIEREWRSGAFRFTAA